MSDSSVESQVKHEVSGMGGKETYVFKLKDKDNRRAIQIQNPDGSPLKLQSITIVKVPNSNNKIEVTLLKIV